MENLSFDDLKPVDEQLLSKSKSGEMFKITDDFIVAGMSGNGGFNYEQLRLLGVETPPRTGWKEKIIGTFIPVETAKKYLQLKGHTKKVARKENIAKIQNELFGSDPSKELTVEEKNIIRYCVEDCYRNEIEKGNTNRVQILKSILDKLIYIRNQE